MPIAIRRPAVTGWQEHAKIAIISMASVACVVGFLLVDRRPPFEYVTTDITPKYSYPGGTITIHRHVIWYRACEGTAWTEIVSADRIITNYDRGSRAPYELGDTRADRALTLPQSIRPGQATYRGVIKFNRCGITSRLVPIEIPYQEVLFEVR